MRTRGTITAMTMDVDAGRILEGRATLDQVGEEIAELLVEIAKGRKTKSEALGH